MSSVRVLLGPPGTGKTTTLLHRIECLLEDGVAPESIAFVSFTKAAVTEARDRACLRFGFDVEQIPNFRTVHAMALNLLGGQKAIGALMSDKHWKDFGESCRYSFTDTRGAESAFFSSFETAGDQIRQIYDQSRLCLCSIENAILRVETRGVLVTADQVREYSARLAAFKHEHSLRDFTDLIELALRSSAKPRVEYAFVDEAQDLNPLQHAVIRHWFLESRTCKVMTFAGDDDQAIFTWAGADPDLLIHAAKTYPTETLDQSYRVPSLVHAMASSIIHQNRKRIGKVYKPRPEPGSLIHVRDLSDAISAPGPKMALVRNVQFSSEAYKDALSKGLIFSSEVGSKAPLDRAGVLGAYTSIANLRAGMAVRANHFSDLFDFIPTMIDGKRFLPHGLKTKLAKNTQPVTLERARIEYGLQDFISGLLATETPCSLSLLRLPLDERRYLDRVLSRFDTNPLVTELTITTMHRSKGRECSTVILCSDWGRSSHAALMRGDREGENRVAYVAVTRAKDSLVIVRPQTDRSYPFAKAAHG